MWCHIGQRTHRSDNLVTAARFDEVQREQRKWPYQLVTDGDRTYWWFQDTFFWDDECLDDEQVCALITSKQERRRRHVERAVTMMSMGDYPREPKRSHIPDDVKEYVMRRDEGQCQACGSRSNLQFDHVIPVAMGGSSEPENLQVLCATCNLRKGPGLST
ncbi:hypothetical protein GCM10009642_07560 [Nocardiopsis metallicus]